VLPAVSFVAVGAARRIGLASGLTLPLVFGATDRLLGVWPFGGLGWGSLAGPQAGTLAAGWIVPVLGGPGLVAALVGVNTLWATLAERIRTRPSPRAWFAATLLAAVTLGLQWPLNSDPWSESASAESRGSESPGTIRTLLVPGQLTLREMHAGEGTPASLRYYLARTLSAFPEPRSGAPGAAASGPRGTGSGWGTSGQTARTLVVWPESAVMEPLNRGHALVDLSAIGTVTDADFLVGSDADEPGRLTNALFLVTGGQFDFTRYDKRHLVPFGEYVPAEFRWAFGRKVTTGDRDYSPGIQPPAVVWGSPAQGGATVGLAICFESILPRHASDAVLAGADLLVVAANDAWLPRYAVDQHIQLSALRGREVGRDVLFVSNGGPALHIVAGHTRARSENAPLFVNPVRRTQLTPWVQWGDWGLLGVAGAGVALGLLGREIRRRMG
jgi:apolipoprotein N-acyltransferase